MHPGPQQQSRRRQESCFIIYLVTKRSMSVTTIIEQAQPPSIPSQSWLPSPRMARKFQVAALYSFIISLLVSIMLLIATYSHTPEDRHVHDKKRLATMFTFTATCFLVMLCTPALVQRKFSAVPYISIACSFTCFILATIAIWRENGSKILGKICITFAMVACGLTYFCQIHLCHRAPLIVVVTAELFMAALLLICFKWLITERVHEGEATTVVLFGYLVVGFSIAIPANLFSRRLAAIDTTTEQAEGPRVAAVDVEAPTLVRPI